MSTFRFTLPHSTQLQHVRTVRDLCQASNKLLIGCRSMSKCKLSKSVIPSLGELRDRQCFVFFPPGHGEKRSMHGTAGTAVFQLGFHIDRLITSMRLMREQQGMSASDSAELGAEVTRRVQHAIERAVQDYRTRHPDEVGSDLRITILITWPQPPPLVAGTDHASADQASSVAQEKTTSDFSKELASGSAQGTSSDGDGSGKSSGESVDASAASAPGHGQEFTVHLHIEPLPPPPSPPIVVEVSWQLSTAKELFTLTSVLISTIIAHR